MTLYSLWYFHCQVLKLLPKILQYEEGVGWVGVQTYVDNAQGTLRVKKEILVSMSGIATGNLPIWDQQSNGIDEIICFLLN